MTSRLFDRAEHFPYRRDDAVSAGVPAALADLTDDYVRAQAEVVSNPTETSRAAYREARDALAAARREDRQGREFRVITDNGSAE